MAEGENEPKCIKCQTKMRHTPGFTFIASEEMATEVTCWLKENVDVGELFYRTAFVGTPLCQKCGTKFRFHRSNKKKAEQEKPVNVTVQVVEEESPITQSSSSQSLSSQSSTNDPTVKFKENEPKKEIEVVELPIKRTVSTHKYCCLCGSTDIKKLTQISFNARSHAYTQTQIFIPKGHLKYITLYIFIFLTLTQSI